MFYVKIILLFLIVLTARSENGEDLQEVKRLGWLRARESYQYNHPPIVEHDLILKVTDTVKDGETHEQGLKRYEKRNKSEESVSILDNKKDFELEKTTVIVPDAETTTNTVDLTGVTKDIKEKSINSDLVSKNRESSRRRKTSRHRQPIKNASAAIADYSVKGDSKTERIQPRKIVNKTTIKLTETKTINAYSRTEPIIKISERPIETSTFAISKSNTRNGKKNSEPSVSDLVKPVLVTKEIFLEKPVSYSTDRLQIEKKYHDVESNVSNSSKTQTSEENNTNTNRLHGNPDPIVPIIQQENRVFSHNGNFVYSYEGGDGTRAFSKGQLKEVAKDQAGEAVEGGFSYTDKDGNDFSLSYTADENGYRPVGAHLPTPPPIPIAIARALAYLATKTTPEPVTERTSK